MEMIIRSCGAGGRDLSMWQQVLKTSEVSPLKAQMGLKLFFEFALHIAVLLDDIAARDE